MNNEITIVRFERFDEETNSYQLQQILFEDSVKGAFQSVFMCLLSRFHINPNSIRFLKGQILFQSGSYDYRLVFVD